MPKYLVQASYTSDGLRGLQKDKASGRRTAVATAVEAWEANWNLSTTCSEKTT